MDELYSMTTAFSLLPFFPPFLGMGRGSMLAPAKLIDIPCIHCGQFLIEVEFSTAYSLVCDNYHCPLFREGQGIELKKAAPPVKRHYKQSPCYFRHLDIKRENYALLRRRGVPAKEAGLYCSIRRTKELLAEIQEGVENGHHWRHLCNTQV